MTVTGQSPLVDASNVTHQTVISKDVIAAVPAARIATAYSALLPGVQTLGLGDPVGRQQLQFAIHGGRSGEQSARHRRLLQSTRGRGRRSLFDSLQQPGIGPGSQCHDRGCVRRAAVRRHLYEHHSEGGRESFHDVSLCVVCGSSRWHTSNLSDELRARGLQNVAGLKKLWDFNPAVGGPLMRDKSRFYSSYRFSGVSQYRAGIHYNLTPTDWVYTPDLNRPAFVEVLDGDYNTRLTWQATPKNKVNLYYDMQPHTVTHRNFDSITAPEATNYTPYQPNYFAQGVWKSTVTSRLLLEGGASGTAVDVNPRLQGDEDPGLSVAMGTTTAVEGRSGMRFRAPGLGYTDQAPAHQVHRQATFRAAATYVTGSHSFKTGFNLLTGSAANIYDGISGDLQVSLLDGVPRSLTQAATPGEQSGKINRDLGIYAQDQWTVRRLTLNLGVRYDHQNNQTEALELPAGRWVTARQFDAVKNAPNWHDISPRLGAAFDVFGDGRTAVKVSVSRYVAGQGALGLTASLHPVSTSVTSVNRTWTDADRDFVPDCDLINPLVNGECGQISDLNFGKNNPRATRYDELVLDGFGVRNYNWEGSAALQRQLTSGVSVNAAYFRRSYGNFMVTDNLEVTPADYDPYCIIAPVDPRLPGGGGNQLCGYYDVSPAKFGLSTNVVTLATEDTSATGPRSTTAPTSR